MSTALDKDEVRETRKRKLDSPDETKTSIPEKRSKEVKLVARNGFHPIVRLRELPFWNNVLPVEVLEVIVAFLTKNFADLCSFGHVCESWRRGCQKAAEEICKKLCLQSLNNDLLHELIRRRRDHFGVDWLGVLNDWFYSGVADPSDTQLVKRSPSNPLWPTKKRRAFTLAPKKKDYEFVVAIGDRVVTQSKNNGICIWNDFGRREVYLEQPGSAKNRIIQVLYADMIDTLFILDRTGALKSMKLPKARAKGDPSVEQLLPGMKIAKFDVDCTTLCVLLKSEPKCTSNEIYVYRISISPATGKVILTFRSNMKTSNVTDVGIWKEQVMFVQARGGTVSPANLRSEIFTFAWQVKDSAGRPIPFTLKRIPGSSSNWSTSIFRSALFVHDKVADSSDDESDVENQDRGEKNWLCFWRFPQERHCDLTLQSDYRTAENVMERFESITCVTMRRRLFVVGTNLGRALIYQQLPNPISTRDMLRCGGLRLKDYFDFSKPPEMILQFDRRGSISNLDVGFHGVDIIVYALFQKKKLKHGRTMNATLERVTIQGGRK